MLMISVSNRNGFNSHVVCVMNDGTKHAILVLNCLFSILLHSGSHVTGNN